MHLPSRTAAALAVAVATAGPVATEAQEVFFRGTSHLVVETGKSEELSHRPISLVVPTPFAATRTKAIVMALTGGGVAGASYRLASAIPGLTADPVSGEVYGTPTSPAGTSVSISVEAVDAKGRVVATSAAVSAVVRDPIAVAASPTATTIKAGEQLPVLSASSTGGNAATTAWSLTGAPAWLEIVRQADGSGRLQVRQGATSAVLAAATIGVVVADAEGRTASGNFVLAVEDVPATGKLVAEDGKASANFGYSSTMSRDGSTVLVGAFTDAVAGNQAGAAYVFAKSAGSWVQQARLQPDDIAASDRFGVSASLSSDGSTALVGAYTKNGTIGAAYVFGRSGTAWTQTAKLTLSGGASSDMFGYALVLSADGTKAFVSSLRANTAKTDAGSVSMFESAGGTWNLVRTLTASDPATGDLFGNSIDLSDDGSRLLVGAPYKATGLGSSVGAAYVFSPVAGQWQQTAKLVSPEAAANDMYGYSTAISGDGKTIMVGAPWRTSLTGGSYVYGNPSGDTWTYQAKLVPSGTATNEFHGYAVSLSRDGNTAFASANGDEGTGAGYVFARTGSAWSSARRITVSGLKSSGSFGSSGRLSQDGSSVVVGGTGNDGKASGSGAAYVLGTN